MKSQCLILLLLIASSYVEASASPQDSEVIKGEKELKVWVDEKEIDGEKVRVVNMTTPTSAVLAPTVVDGPTLCAVEVSTEYWQANDNVKVEAYIDTPDCGAAHGIYEVSVRTMNEEDEHHTEKYSEVWSRDSTDAVKLIHVYGMNGDSDLVKVRIKMAGDGSCICGLKRDLGQDVIRNIDSK